MIKFYGRNGNYLGQTPIVTVDAPLTPLVPVTPVVAPGPVVVETPVVPVYEDRVSLTKAGILVGGIVLVALAVTLSKSLSRR